MGFFLLYVVYVLVNPTYLQGPAWLLPLGILLVGVLAAGLVYSGYWVATRAFTTTQGWRVTTWLFAGVIGGLALTFWPIFYQRIVGVAIEDPVFILLVSSGLGANAGVVAGIAQVQAQRRLQHVQEVRDSLEFLNRLLRHNVLNAIAVIRGNAELLVEEASADAAVEQAYTICEYSDRIDELIENTQVLVQRIEADPEHECINLTATVTEEIATARQTYDEAIIDQDLASAVEVQADPLVSTVIENLVRNAIIHNDQEPPRVEVALDTAESAAMLQIADNGPGLPAEDPDALVEPGTHGDHGLGLYLVDTLVSQYGGDLSFDTNEPRGTVVTVELPLA